MLNLTRIILFIFCAIPIFTSNSCEASVPAIPEHMQAQIENSDAIFAGTNYSVVGNSEYNPKPTDTLKVIVKITSIIPINWGIEYGCEVTEIIGGRLIEIDSSFILSVSVGSDRIFNGIDYLELHESYTAWFVKSKVKTDKDEPYLHAGTTGLLDKRGYVWDLISIKKMK